MTELGRTLDRIHYRMPKQKRTLEHETQNIKCHSVKWNSECRTYGVRAGAKVASPHFTDEGTEGHIRERVRSHNEVLRLLHYSPNFLQLR